MNQIKHNSTIYNLHPIYDSYASNVDGYIIDINKFALIKSKYHKRHPHVNLKYGPCEVKYPVYQFVWECYNGVIPKMNEYFFKNVVKVFYQKIVLSHMSVVIKKKIAYIIYC